METEFTTDIQRKKVDELHFETQRWKSNIWFMKDEITFISHLLNSYVFEPNTPNLFEKLQDYLKRVQKMKIYNDEIEKSIAKHEQNLDGLLECTDVSCDLEYYSKHEKIKAEMVDCQERFKELKSEVFNYAGGILKKRKPNS